MRIYIYTYKPDGGFTYFSMFHILLFIFTPHSSGKRSNFTVAYVWSVWHQLAFGAVCFFWIWLDSLISKMSSGITERRMKILPVIYQPHINRQLFVCCLEKRGHTYLTGHLGIFQVLNSDFVSEKMAEQNRAKTSKVSTCYLGDHPS